MDLVHEFMKWYTDVYTDGILYNHLIYADDTVLIAPSDKALQGLINISVNFAKENILFIMRLKEKSGLLPQNALMNYIFPNFSEEIRKFGIIALSSHMGQPKNWRHYTTSWRHLRKFTSHSLLFKVTPLCITLTPWRLDYVASWRRDAVCCGRWHTIYYSVNRPIWYSIIEGNGTLVVSKADPCEWYVWGLFCLDCTFLSTSPKPSTPQCIYLACVRERYVAF